MPKIYNKTPVCLKKTAFWECIQPIRHISYRLVTFLHSENHNFAFRSFNDNNISSRDGMDVVFGFHRYQKGGCMIEVDSILHIAEKTLLFQRLGKITEYVKTHSLIQIFRVRCDNKNDTAGLLFFNSFPT